ncbi:hypothetical protein J4447_00550 [Candidatus Pacearchaeota archaeon]|nr:hypothetical protein [Candidatus Pacearchaeota archaeon]
MTFSSFTITKRIAKHGNQAIIVVPRILEQHLKPGTVVKLDINVIQAAVEEAIKIKEADAEESGEERK